MTITHRSTSVTKRGFRPINRIDKRVTFASYPAPESSAGASGNGDLLMTGIMHWHQGKVLNRHHDRSKLRTEVTNESSATQFLPKMDQLCSKPWANGGDSQASLLLRLCDEANHSTRNCPRADEDKVVISVADLEAFTASDGIERDILNPFGEMEGTWYISNLNEKNGSLPEAISLTEKFHQKKSRKQLLLSLRAWKSAIRIFTCLRTSTLYNAAIRWSASDIMEQPIVRDPRATPEFSSNFTPTSGISIPRLSSAFVITVNHGRDQAQSDASATKNAAEPDSGLVVDIHANLRWR
ncbi:hypothetical protein FBEOM_9768 [Fusarium beomiforme]|uniref:Uncharacterized protein n=1 Tax=Fusarium beomiforme TaxID=44412 RepID=A0A9P5ACI1_9HYPO|nr:hypothetical protein FBEOM_9768 [Fusarium beomiforme]